MTRPIPQRTVKAGISQFKQVKKIITREIDGVIHKTLPEGTHLRMTHNKPTVISGKNVSFTTPNGDYVSLAHGKAEYGINMGSWQVKIPEGSRAKVVKTSEKHNKMKNGIITVNSDTTIRNEGIIDSAYGRMLVNDGGKMKKANLYNSDSSYGLQNYTNIKYYPKGKKAVIPGKIDKVVVSSSTGKKNTANIINDGIINDLKIGKEYADNLNYMHHSYKGKVGESNVPLPKDDFYYQPLPE